MNIFAPPTILIATLGAEPQVVTLALDALLAQGKPITNVVVVHTNPSDEPIAGGLARLQQEFAEYVPYRAISLKSLVLTSSPDNAPLNDLLDTEEINAAFAGLYKFLHQQKSKGHGLHLLIAGGRKTMAIFAFAAAQIIFGEDDHVWHLVSDERLRQTRRLHAQPHDRIHLIEVPFVRWNYLPGTPQFLAVGARTALAQVDTQHQQLRRRQAQAFLKQLSRAEREVVQLLVETALTNDALAARLEKSPRTIANQLSSIYRKFAVFYALPGDAAPDRTQLVAALRGVI